jgi:hypothetical protein
VFVFERAQLFAVCIPAAGLKKFSGTKKTTDMIRAVLGGHKTS